MKKGREEKKLFSLTLFSPDLFLFPFLSLSLSLSLSRDGTSHCGTPSSLSPATEISVGRRDCAPSPSHYYPLPFFSFSSHLSLSHDGK